MTKFALFMDNIPWQRYLDKYQRNSKRKQTRRVKWTEKQKERLMIVNIFLFKFFLKIENWSSEIAYNANLNLDCTITPFKTKVSYGIELEQILV